MGQSDQTISEDIRTAQQQLLKLRARLQVTRSEGNTQKAPLFSYCQLGKRPSLTTAVSQLPAHLGWESIAFTQALRQNRTAKERPNFDTQSAHSAQTAVPSPTLSFPKTIKVYPDIAIGLLRETQVAAGRLWLLLQAVDQEGRGWIAENNARRWFTGKRAPLRFCGVRQLRNLLVQGDDVFWVRENDRIWLRSVAKVAFALAVPKLKMRPVALPLHILRQKIGTVRAHLYATFHSSRSQANRAKKPIARATVTHLTQVQPRTQRRYERKARVKKQRQFAVGPQATVENLQTRGWEQGQATFQFKDFNGKQGQPGSNYVAWQLPNSYVGPHAHLPKGRQKRINQTLTDLFMKGMTGNGQRPRVEARRFFDNGRLAAKSYLRNPEKDHYWRGVGNGRYQLWQVMESNQVK